ncbi:hypothetical protein DFQ27_003234 [Actinomortierella ambigua]|uniref:NADP-dependent oxidoreductase domain-containing protein n=1 Tax=Actinomortierella ambigua TaxID=1343610 RepID=A0A9P6Q8R0_9FUNG|nr:hypothetical protein DFQ27_003234 [Actinomortierella ambigua]
MSLGRVTKLNNGVTMPLVGLGTWQSSTQQVGAAVSHALKVGYRHIDTAWIYGNEKQVGEAIRDSGIPRKEIFVTTKLWNHKHRAQDVHAAFETSLQNLGLDYLDLYLIHWPCAFQAGDVAFPKGADGKPILEETDFTETWKAMEQLLDTGKVRAIGVSNFSVKNLEKLLKTAKVVPAVNQVEMHPELPQWGLLEYCRSKGIHMTAYSPLGSTDSALMKRPTLTEIAKKYDTQNANILISWAAQRGTSVIPKSVTLSRVENNFKDLELDAGDVAFLNTIADDGVHRYCVPDWEYDIFGEL